MDTIVERVVEQLRPKDPLDGLVNTGVDGPAQVGFAFDHEVWARENVQRRAGLPRAHIWSYVVGF